MTRSPRLLPYARTACCRTSLATIVGWGLPFAEIALGLLLLAGIATRVVAAASAILLVIFIAAVASAAARGLSIDCGCFGGGGEVAPGQTAYGIEILRDIGLLLLAVWLVWQPRQPVYAGSVLQRGASDTGIGMSSSKNVDARERARLAAEQAAARKRDQRILISVVAAFVVLVVAGGILFQGWRSSRSPSAAPSASSSAAPVTITNGKPIPLGSADAPVTITLYEDFHCPHCADFEEEFGPTITQAQESGAARVELYPMSFIDEGSITAANAMACAAEAGFGQAYYLGLFANHTLQWSDPQLIELATKVGRNAVGRVQDLREPGGPTPTG